MSNRSDLSDSSDGECTVIPLPAPAGVLLFFSAIIAPPVVAEEIDRTQLIGTWAAGGSCESDTVEFYRSDGTLETPTSAGRWSLRGDQLTIIVTSAGEMGEAFQPLNPVHRDVVTLLSVSGRERKERWRDGSVHYIRRCG
jgi:hypothetical protein